MSVLRSSIFLLLALAGFLGTQKLAQDNGLLDAIEAQIMSGKAHLPSTNIPLRTQWTGYHQIDRLLSTLVMFFFPLLDKTNISLYFEGLHFFGLWMSTWLLILLESFRKGNAGLLVSYVGIAGLLMEFGAVAMVLPLWCLLHVTTSPLVSRFDREPVKITKHLVSVDPHDLKILPWTFALSVGAPVFCMSVAPPQITVPLLFSKQFWILARLFHPVIAVSAYRLLKSITEPPKQVVKASPRQQTMLPDKLETIYTIATSISAVPHIVISALVTLSYLLPGMIPAGLQRSLHISAIWPFTTSQITNPIDGISTFLAWDELIATVTVLVWAFAINDTARSAPARPNVSSRGWALARTILVAATLGPAASAVSLIRERDEVFLSEKQGVSERKNGA